MSRRTSGASSTPPAHVLTALHTHPHRAKGQSGLCFTPSTMPACSSPKYYPTEVREQDVGMWAQCREKPRKSHLRQNHKSPLKPVPDLSNVTQPTSYPKRCDCSYPTPMTSGGSSSFSWTSGERGAVCNVPYWMLLMLTTAGLQDLAGGMSLPGLEWWRAIQYYFVLWKILS